MKVDRGIILSSKELYAQKKNNSNCSLILISSKCGTSVKNYLSNSLIPACILLCNKNKALYRFLIDFKKFVKLLSLSIFYCSFSRRTPQADRVKEPISSINSDTLRESASVKLVLNHTKIVLHVI
ncbi:hypothetical protein OFQ45_01310 [Brachyspira hyodysenteriae]|uniref:hypothetical protein n=2 Tax=Brachyspira hyodysenteriae TaxID=159 RepID=UPI0022CD2745|nr:hypothetical protein [Brachyspira hyodysenteriae]MCZ9852151.1 hypothetical protein [Brachyspira hyodysenteriae]MCZ9861775.1 hypothetical protein [Brachyspira hyodysenteriae]MCZ9915565.1 hypothetical protein [Brachyspira hyodysenteriae]MCZ9937369.1 hypothetical protein [Brachyspira hyodysenteriae]MCZ9949284.1 hypothetical protein [Brachyspira hyodysenteriae]